MSITDKIGIGTVQFGLDYGISNLSGKILPTEVSSILSYAQRSGIQYLDTASAYGDSESVLGGYGAANNFRIVSKFMPSKTDGSILVQFEQSCKSLKTENLYAYLSHRPLALLDNTDDWDVIQTLKIQNRVKKIGFSLNNPKELEALIAKGLIPDLVQVPFNYFDNRFEPLIIELKKNGCEIHTRSAFLQGLFFADVLTLPKLFDDVKDDIRLLQDTYGNNLPRVLLRYVLSRPFVDIVIIGVESTQQLRENLVGIEGTSELIKLGKNIPENIITPSKWT